MMIALMIPMDKAALANGTLWPRAWDNDGVGIFGPMDFPELEGGIPRFPEDAATQVQEEIEGFFRIGHERLVLETRSEAVIERVREMVRTRKELQAAVYLVRGVEEERHDILPDGSFHPPLDLKAKAAIGKGKSGKLPVFGEPPTDEPDWDPLEEDGGREVSFELGEVDHHGELELILEVNGAKDSAWLSKEMWERMGEVAGWKSAPSMDVVRLERLISDVEKAAKDGHDTEQHRLAARLDSCVLALRALLPLQSLVEEQKRAINEGIEITHDQAIRIEQLEALITETNLLLNTFVAKRFVELRAAWSRATGFLSNPHKIIEHSTYREIVAMGWPVVPYLLGDLAGEDPCHFWAQALHEITGEQITLAKEDYGKSSAISAAWLELAKKKGWTVCPTEKKSL